jgi:hypothetical protein
MRVVGRRFGANRTCGLSGTNFSPREGLGTFCVSWLKFFRYRSKGETREVLASWSFIDKDGSMYVTDDASRSVWHVTYEGRWNQGKKDRWR